MKLYAVLLRNGKWLSRGRRDPAWDGSFEVDSPETWTDGPRALEAAKTYDGALIRLAFDNKPGTASDAWATAWAEQHKSDHDTTKGEGT